MKKKSLNEIKLSNNVKNALRIINDKLMDLNKKEKEISNTDEQKQINGTTNNNVFLGSTSDLQGLSCIDDKS